MDSEEYMMLATRSGHCKSEAEKMLKNIKFWFAEDVDKHDFKVDCSSFYILRPQEINLVKIRLKYLLIVM
jgi:hypothetical protein